MSGHPKVASHSHIVNTKLLYWKIRKPLSGTWRRRVPTDRRGLEGSRTTRGSPMDAALLLRGADRLAVGAMLDGDAF